MVASLGVVALALRAGLRLRRARFGRGPRAPDLLRDHLRFAKPAIALVFAGFLSGPISAVWLRDWTPFATFHAWLGFIAAALFLAVAVLGWRLERADRVAQVRRGAHINSSIRFGMALSRFRA